MKTHAIRELIAKARLHEEQSSALARFLSNKIPELHRAIKLPATGAGKALTEFVIAYIEQVPDVLEAAAEVAREAGIEDVINPVLMISEHLLLQPLDSEEAREGLVSWLGEAYLAHRLVEEVNDRYITHLGRPLIPLDTTRANLIAHYLIGEAFANPLDRTVEATLKEMITAIDFQPASVQTFRERLSSPNIHNAWQRWPCMSRTLGIDLNLTS